MTLERIGRYEILRPLGRGAMGVVYLARDPQMDRQIALKTVRFDGSGDSKIDEAKARFLKEARISGRLQHPHIVTVFDVGEDSGNLYLAMEYVAGGSLAQKLLEPPGRLELFDRIRIIAEVAEALGHAHERGVLHRDVKPANILLTEALGAKVSDFGIGKLLSGDTDLTSTGQMVGSPAYMSPEQIRGEKLDVRSDIFSLGVVLYQTLTSRKPFPADTLTTLVYQILHEEPIDISTLRSDLPEGLPAILKKCLAKNRDERYANAGEAVAELSDLLGYSPVGSTATLTESNVRRAQRMSGDSSARKRPSLEFGFSAPASSKPAEEPVSDTIAVPRTEDPLPGSVPPAASSGAGSGKRSRNLVIAGILALLAGWALFASRRSAGPQKDLPPVATPQSGVVRATPTLPPLPVVVATSPTPESTRTSVPVPTDGLRVVERISPTRTPRIRPTPTAPAVASPTPAPTPTPRLANLSVAVRRSLRLNISPDQARIFLDGKYIGIADDWDDSGGGSLLTFNTEGHHRLRFAYPERSDLLLDVTVSPGATQERAEIEQKLAKGTPEGSSGPEGKIKRPNYKTVGPVRFVVDPPQAVVEVNGKFRGPATAYLTQDLIFSDMAVYDVVLTAVGYESRAVRVLVGPSAGEVRAVVKEKLKKLN